MSHTSYKMTSIFLSVLFLFLVPCFCQYAPYAHLYTTAKPHAEDVVGTFDLKEQTLTSGGLKIFQGEQPRFEFHADGTFTANNFPIWKTTNIDYELDGFTFLTGKWEIGTVGGASNGVDKAKPVWGIYLRNTVPTQAEPFSATLTGNEPPSGLIFEYGDPDSGTVMIFEKVK